MYKWSYMRFCVKREGESHTYSRKAAELYVVEVCRGVVLHQQILFVDGHVPKSTKIK